MRVHNFDYWFVKGVWYIFFIIKSPINLWLNDLLLWFEHLLKPLSSQKHMFLRVIVLINILWFQRNVLVLYKGETLLPHSQLYIILVNGFFLGTF